MNYLQHLTVMMKDFHEEYELSVLQCRCNRFWSLGGQVKQVFSFAIEFAKPPEVLLVYSWCCHRLMLLS